jgi:branched-chain amino acid aminotransferase
MGSLLMGLCRLIPMTVDFCWVTAFLKPWLSSITSRFGLITSAASHAAQSGNYFLSLFAGLGAVLKKSQVKFEALRITLSRGKTERGLAGDGTYPSLLMTLDGFDTKNLFQPCRLKVSSVRRNEFAPSSRLKTLSYIDGIAAAREVVADADDALMLNTRGHVASSTVANIFLLQGNELVTPSLNQGILPGITRRVLLDNAKSMGFVPVEKTVSLEDLFRADAVFLCNSLRFLRPVTMLNGNFSASAQLMVLRTD